jgi:hypothetical protein
VGSGEAALHEIVAALRGTRKPDEPACALCLRSSQNVTSEVRAFFAEYVNDPQAREVWRLARGFCIEHTALLATTGDALAIAILYADLARLTRERWQAGIPSAARSSLLAGLRGGRHTAGNGPCPACTITHAADVRNASALAQALKENRSEVWEALEASTGLCAAHVEQVMALCPQPVADRLRRQELERLSALQAELEEIIRKNDYRFRGEPWGAEKNAWLRALQKLRRP